MVLSVELAAWGILLTALLAAAAVASRALTPEAGGVAALFGSIIVVVGGFAFLALLVLFVVASVLATRFGFEEKKRANLHEGTHGERGVSNVLAHIVVPTALVLTGGFLAGLLPRPTLVVLYTAALAFGAADTFASEFGVLAGHARSILSLKPVAPGTNGGVSAVGEMWAVVGALTTAIVALLIFFAVDPDLTTPAVLLGIPTIAGFLGCQVDSVLGETLENRGLLTKGSTNLLAMLASVGIAGFLVVLAGGSL